MTYSDTNKQEIVHIDGIPLHLSSPISVQPEWIGQKEPLEQLLACWLTLSDQDRPLSPRIVGTPGLGKTTMAIAAAHIRKQPVYIFQCTSDTRPEDLLVTPVLGPEQKILYHASPLVTAMIQGGICILDEGNRMSEKSWASLAPLLDDRKQVESIVAGIRILAHAEFRCAITMNDDSSTFEIPDYIMSRLQPTIQLGFPDKEDELRILRYNLPNSDEELIKICTQYLQEAHALALPYSIRDGIHLIRYAERLKIQFSLSHQEAFHRSITQVLSEEALDLKQLSKNKHLNEFQNNSLHNLGDMNLGDFFFGEDNDMNPDQDIS